MVRLVFTQEEFDTMVNQLLVEEPVSYDMLCMIADKVLRPTVIYWCKNEDSLRGRDCENDIMQDIYLRLIKKTIGYFLLRSDMDDQVNLDPEGFEDWLFRVARNIKRDHARKNRSHDIKNTELDGSETAEMTSDWTGIGEDRVERLRAAFDVVISADVSVYKTLTWLAQSLLVLYLDITKIRANEQILEKYSHRTLNEMYDSLRQISGQIPWMHISENQHRKIRAALDAPWEKDMTFGQLPYRTFFMKYRGEESGKKSISDWVNRLNAIIRRNLDKYMNEPADGAASMKRGTGNGPSNS